MGHYISSLEKCMLKSFVYFKNWVVSYIVELWEFFAFHGYKSITRYVFYKYFLPICMLSLHFLPGILCNTEVFSFDENQFIYFAFIVCAFCVVPKKLLPNLKFGKFTPMFSSKTVIVVALAFLDMIYFELIFLHCV